MNQDFVFKKYHVSTSVYPVGRARCAEGGLAPCLDLPSSLTVGWWQIKPQLSQFHLSPGLQLLNSLSLRPVASSTATPKASPVTAIWLTAQSSNGLLPPASYLFLTGSQRDCYKTQL